MKPFSILTMLGAFFGLVSASISIPEPANNATLVAGQNTTIAVTSSEISDENLSIAITIANTVLYNGTYTPAFGPGNLEAPTQEFNVLIPVEFEKGIALLNVVVTGGPESEKANATVNIV